MKITTLCICGEADHPLLQQFRDHYSQISDQVIIQMGVTEKWLAVNGDTSLSGNIFPTKVEQQNAAIARVDPDTDYLFFFDVDEFMPLGDDYLSIMGLITYNQPDIIEFQMNQFWKDDNYIGYGGDGWAYDAWSPRIYRYEPGMKITSHRPPVINYQHINPITMWQGVKINHYSYVYPEQVRRKLLYYNLIYPEFDYMEWFKNVYLAWTPENRIELEQTRSIHPSCEGAKSKLFIGKHDIQWQISEH